ncbi:MAG: hypothetical protein AAFX93_10890 [Verrucomicrobiota bacterium]
MSLQIDIDNVLEVSCDDAQKRESALSAAKDLVSEAGDKVQVSDDRIFFHCEWEPPFKQLKKLSAAHTGVTFTLWSEAFQQHHWISKVDYVDGKGAEETLSRIDDEFPAVFKEIFSAEESSWEKSPTPGFQTWFPSR